MGFIVGQWPGALGKAIGCESEFTGWIQGCIRVPRRPVDLAGPRSERAKNAGVPVLKGGLWGSLGLWRHPEMNWDPPRSLRGAVC